MSRLGEREPIVIVGAGPAGSLLSVYLARHGHRVELYESRPDLRSVDISAGRSINLAVATRGIATLVDIGVMDRVDEITVPMTGRMIHDGEAISYQPYGTRPHEVIYSVSRSSLNGILLDAAEATGLVTVHFEQRLRGVDLAARTLRFSDAADGDRAYDLDFGVVFGTDGVNSQIREAVVAANGGEVSTELLGHGYKELTIAPAADGAFQLDPNGLHIWPRGEFMLIALANPAGDFTATLFLPNEGADGSFAALGSDTAVDAFFRREFPDFVELVPDLAEQFRANRTGWLATIRTTGWSHDDTAVILGDAAHAIVPFHGQGMNLAMESCKVLDEHLRAQPEDLAGAFAAFEATRRPDADAIADMALHNYVEMRSDVVDDDYLLDRALALALEKRFPERFSPHYALVMFNIIPYAEAKARADQQARILDTLTAGIDSLDAVDYHHAAKLVAELDLLPALPERLRYVDPDLTPSTIPTLDPNA